MISRMQFRGWGQMTCCVHFRIRRWVIAFNSGHLLIGVTNHHKLCKSTIALDSAIMIGTITILYNIRTFTSSEYFHSGQKI